MVADMVAVADMAADTGENINFAEGVEGVMEDMVVVEFQRS